jgi:hypothetical protein
MEEIGLFPAFTNQNSGINVNNWKNGALQSKARRQILPFFGNVNNFQNW